MMRPGDIIHWNKDADAARKYVLDSGLTADDVKLVKRGDMVHVVVKRPCLMKLPGMQNP
jgi:hypothetical protein